MSELNVTALSSGFIGSEQESNTIQSVTTQLKRVEISSQIVAKREANKENELSPSEAKETVQEVNDLLQSMHRNLSFSFDEQLGQSIILVKDSESEEVIRQIPSEELVVLRKKMDDVVGILFDTKV